MKTFYLLSITTLFLASCGDGGGDYVGKWVSEKNECRTFEIEKNGPNYLVRITEPNMFARRLSTLSLPATLKDGILSAQGSMGGAFIITYRKANGTLITPQGDYHRPSKEDKQCALSDKEEKKAEEKPATPPAEAVNPAPTAAPDQVPEKQEKKGHHAVAKPRKPAESGTTTQYIRF